MSMYSPDRTYTLKNIVVSSGIIAYNFSFIGDENVCVEGEM